MRRLFASAFVAGALLLASLPVAADPQKSWLDLAEDQARMGDGPGLISQAIDYAALRTAMQIEPDMIRARIKACGSCKERASLEKKLAVAERDKQALESLESFVGKVHNMDPWAAWKIGIKIRPDAVMRQPPACIALYDRAQDCAVAHDDRYAGQPGGVCHAEQHLYQLCGMGKAKPFYDYVDFLRKKERGDLVFETADGSYFYYYNVRPDMVFPTRTIEDSQSRYGVYTDNQQPGSLASLLVSGMALMGPDIELSMASDFRKPWSTIVHEDNLKVSSTARLIECNYVLAPKRIQKFKFWYRQRPAGADPAYLSSRMKDHPLLRVGAPVSTCPASLAEARAIGTIVAREELERRYGAMLKQPGASEDSGAASPEETLRRNDAAAERNRRRGR